MTIKTFLNSNWIIFAIKFGCIFKFRNPFNEYTKIYSSMLLEGYYG